MRPVTKPTTATATAGGNGNGNGNGNQGNGNGQGNGARAKARGRAAPVVSDPDYNGNPYNRPLGPPLPPSEQNKKHPENSGQGSSPGDSDHAALSGGLGMMAAAATTAALGSGTRLAKPLLAAASIATSMFAAKAFAQTAVKTLIVYDTTGQWGFLGELYAMMAANLASHFGTWTTLPVVSYTAGKLSSYSAVIYIGSTYDEPIPTAFLDDVLNTTKPVIWIYDNIWQLTARTSNFASIYGWMWSGFDYSSVASVNYKNQSLSRYSANAAGIMNYSSVGTGVTVLGNAVRSDNTTFPWAVRSKNLTYLGENPLIYIAEGDRYLIFSDLLFDALAPATVTRHRGLLRIEDINATNDPAQLRAVADYLFSKGVPFGFGVSPLYTNPLGSPPQTIRLKDAPTVVSALKYMQTKGGVLVDHGYTHQYSNVINPYSGETGDDFEFYRVTENADHTLNYQGPVAENSQAWAAGRITSAFSEFTAAGFAKPKFWEFPHYFGSAADYKAVKAQTAFSARWERSLYFRGLLSGGTIDYTRYVGQQFPYVVTDIYGTKVLPENLGCVEPEPFFQFPIHTPAQIVADAQRNLVVRDGFASMFFHPFWDISLLQSCVEGIQGLGYTFVSPTTL